LIELSCSRAVRDGHSLRQILQAPGGDVAKVNGAWEPQFDAQIRNHVGRTNHRCGNPSCERLVSRAHR